MKMQSKTSGHQPVPLPELEPVALPFWDGLARGELLFQRCQCCAQAWLPAREQCPNCLAADVGWELASGQAQLVSWVTYHVSFHAAFKDRLPYIVAIVALSEGPRMLTNIIEVASEAELSIDAELSLVIEQEGEMSVARFKPVLVSRGESDR